MTKKHFEALALAMNEARNRITRNSEFANLKALNEDIMNICEQMNPNFDREKYLKVVNKPKEPSSEIPKRMQEMLTIPNE